MQQPAPIAIAIAIASLSLLACSAPESPSMDGGSFDLATRLQNSSRSADDRARDAGRKPAEVIDVLGIEPGMRVIDIIAAGGWYSEVLSVAVGANGSVAAMNPPRVLSMRDGANEKALSARLAGHRLPNVSRIDKDFPDLGAHAEEFDAGITALNLHDIYNRGGDEAAISMLQAVYDVLKPAGIFGVIDHNGVAEQDNFALHRMQKSDAIRLAKAAGFVVEADSGVLHFHSDDMSKHMRDDSVRGRTHRFLLKLRKPN